MEQTIQTGSTQLSFKLAGETYAIEILKVREIIGLMEITAVPRTARHIRGVVNLRGKIVPVLDLRAKFGLPEAETRRENCIITAMIGSGSESILVGLLVDSVSEVLSVGEADIEPVPALNDVKLPFVTGLAKSQDKVRILLDIDKVVQSQDLGALQQGLEQSQALVEAAS